MVLIANLHNLSAGMILYMALYEVWSDNIQTFFQAQLPIHFIHERKLHFFSYDQSVRSVYAQSF